MVFAIENENPVAIVPTGPKFSRDVTLDRRLLKVLCRERERGVMEPRKIVEAKWRLGRFWVWAPHETFPFQLRARARILGIRLEGMNDMGYLWSEFVNVGKFYTAQLFSTVSVVQLENAEGEGVFCGENDIPQALKQGLPHASS